MTISATADRILEHPYFAEICEVKDRGALRILLIDLMAHVSMTQNGLDARTYMKRRWNTHPDINRAIREMGCGVELCFQLPCPGVVPRCVVVDLVRDEPDKEIKRG